MTQSMFEQMGADLIRRAEAAKVSLPEFYEGLRDIQIMLEDRIAAGEGELRELRQQDENLSEET